METMLQVDLYLCAKQGYCSPLLLTIVNFIMREAVCWSMVKCDNCGKTDGCSFHDYGDKLLCFRCYRAARDEEYERRHSDNVKKSLADRSTAAN